MKPKDNYDDIIIEKKYWKSWKYFLSFYKKTPIRTLIISLVALISSAITITIPFLTQGLKDATTNSTLNIFIYLAISIILIYVLKVICDFINEFLGSVFDYKLEIEWRKQLVEKMYKLPMIDFDNRPLTDYVSRVVVDLKDMLNFAFRFLTNFIYVLVVMVGGFTYAFSVNWFVGIIPLIIVLVSIVIYICCVRSFVITKHYTKGLNSRVVWKTGENVRLISEIKSYAINNLMMNNYEQLQDRYLKASAKSSLQASLIKIIGIATNVFTSALFIVLASYENMNGEISDAELVGLTSATSLLVLPLTNLSTFFVNIISISPTLSRLYYWINLDEEDIMNMEKGLRPNVLGKIEFKNVSFSYDLNGEKVSILKNFNMVVNENEYVNLFGLSGQGKTTIFKLLLRFYDIDEGQILIDDIDIRDINLTYLRTTIGYISTDPKLFSNVFETEEFHSNNEKYNEILKELDLIEVYERKRKGDQNLSSQDFLLSDGEKQMLSIARAIYFDTKILLIDNIEKSLDQNQIAKVNLLLSKIKKNKTIIIATSNNNNCFNSYKQLNL